MIGSVQRKAWINLFILPLLCHYQLCNHRHTSTNKKQKCAHLVSGGAHKETGGLNLDSMTSGGDSESCLLTNVSLHLLVSTLSALTGTFQTSMFEMAPTPEIHAHPENHPGTQSSDLKSEFLTHSYSPLMAPPLPGPTFFHFTPPSKTTWLYVHGHVYSDRIPKPTFCSSCSTFSVFFH